MAMTEMRLKRTLRNVLCNKCHCDILYNVVLVCWPIWPLKLEYCVVTRPIISCFCFVLKFLADDLTNEF